MKNFSTIGQSNDGEESLSYPDYLQSYEDLAQFVRGQMEFLNTTEKGSRFAQTVRKLIPQTEIGTEFNVPVIEKKKSNDEGIDLTAQSKDGRSRLYIQSKLLIDRADTIDSILSKFQSYHALHNLDSSGRQYLLDLEDTTSHFMIVTLSSLKSILERYIKEGVK